MAGYWPAVALAVIGVVMLVALTAVALSRLRMLRQATDVLREGVATGTAPLAAELATVRAHRTTAGRAAKP